jgi:hypothetical protein
LSKIVDLLSLLDMYLPVFLLLRVCVFFVSPCTTAYKQTQ